MPFTEITPYETLIFMASKSDADTFETTPEELREFANYIEKQRPSYRVEDFSNFDSLNCILGMKDWAATMIYPTYQGKYDKWQWDKVEVRRKHPRWNYMYDRYVPKSELEYFEKAYEQYINDKNKKQ
jgi:hypothetical protein